LNRLAAAETLEQEISALADLERALVTLHHEDFPAATLPQVPKPAPTDVASLSREKQDAAVRGINVFKRAARKTARAEAHTAAIAEAQFADGQAAIRHARAVEIVGETWAKLLAHDQVTVMETLEEAFADNVSAATCVDVGVDEGVRYATVVIVFGAVGLVPERTSSLTPTGRSTTRKRTKSERNNVYVDVLGSTVLATVREVLAVAPSVDEVRVAVLRQDPEAASPAGYLTAIFTAVYDRARLEDADWSSIDPGRALLTAPQASFLRKGAAGDVVAIDLSGDPELDSLVTEFASQLKTETV
jgi:hypothetical protein